MLKNAFHLVIQQSETMSGLAQMLGKADSSEREGKKTLHPPITLSSHAPGDPTRLNKPDFSLLGENLVITVLHKQVLKLEEIKENFLTLKRRFRNPKCDHFPHKTDWWREIKNLRKDSSVKKEEVIFFFRVYRLLPNSNYKDKAIIPLLCYGSTEATLYL